MHEQENDLRPENMESPINVYICETWSNAVSPSYDGMTHDVHTAYVASTFDMAQKFCMENPDFGGKEDFWHWNIYRIPMNYDPTIHVFNDTESWKLSRFGELEDLYTYEEEFLLSTDKKTSRDVNSIFCLFKKKFLNLKSTLLTNLDRVKK